MPAPRRLAVAAALTGALGVALGAFASHGADAEARPLLATAGQYLMIHALFGLICAWLTPRAALLVWAGRLAIAGGMVFAGALSLIGLAGWRFMGAVAPLGGLLMISAWLFAAYIAFRSWPQLVD